MAELVYAHDLKSCLARDVGSTPTPGTGRKQTALLSCGVSKGFSLFALQMEKHLAM